MSGSLFIMQASKFLLINATAMTLGQGHGKVIQYYSPDLYNPTYLTFSSKGFDQRGKGFAAVDAVYTVSDVAEMNRKHKVTPDWGDLTRWVHQQPQYYMIHIKE